jgi:hypothetical protein
MPKSKLCFYFFSSLLNEKVYFAMISGVLKVGILHKFVFALLFGFTIAKP